MIHFKVNALHYSMVLYEAGRVWNGEIVSGNPTSFIADYARIAVRAEATLKRDYP